MNIWQRFGVNVRKIRMEKGLTQERLAELAQIEPRRLQLIESKTPPNVTLETLSKIASALKIKPSDLLK